MNDDRPNIILISLDTVRADHLSCYGYEKPTTPNIDKLAEEGTLFEHAYSTAVWTPPAHASMFTGLYPSEHGVIDQNSLDPDIPTIAEILAAHGYHTAGFVNNSQVGQLVGLDKGHETFLEIWRGTKSHNILERGMRFLTRKFIDTLGFKDHGARTTNRFAFKWLDEVRKDNKPFYLFIHYIDVHNPMKPPYPYRTMFHDKDASGEIDKHKVKKMANNPLSFYSQNIKLNEDERRSLIALYDGGLAYLDKKVGELVNYLKEYNLFDNTLIAITADHGEHFGEHGHYSHVSSLYQPIIHIPLIMRMPKVFAKGNRTKYKSQLIDIFPTFCDIAYLETDICSSISGRSLLNCSEKDSNRRYIFCEWEGRVPYFILADLQCSKSDQRVQRFTQPINCIIENKFKYILSPGAIEELYNLEQDPDETDNVIAHYTSEAALLREHLQEWKNTTHAKFKDNTTPLLDEETKKHLEALGYM